MLLEKFRLFLGLIFMSIKNKPCYSAFLCNIDINSVNKIYQNQHFEVLNKTLKISELK